MQHIRAGAMVLVIGAVLVSGLLLSRGREGGASSLPTMGMPTAKDRVLVIAPHCDDETLGPGGLLFSAVHAGAQVRVILDTNGDGFRYGAERLFHEKSVAPLDYMRMGLDRQRETFAALAELGVPEKAVSFLGYPDGGTDDMWLTYWDRGHPYTSPRTLDDRSPYPNAFTPHAPYSGRSLLDDLEKVIAEFMPTLIIAPHPNDEHPDHWAAYCYTVAALYELGLLDSVQVKLYIVHRKHWPTPRGLHRNLSLLPPAELLDLKSQWAASPLNASAQDAKYQASLRYRSQLLVMSDFLMSFDRTNELFDTIPRETLPVVPPDTIRIDGQTGDWARIAPAILDPAETRAELPASADLLQVSAATDGGRLYVWVDLAGPPTADVVYGIRLHPLSGSRVGPPQEHTFCQGGGAKAEARFTETGLEAGLALPKGEAPDGVMLAAVTMRRGKIVDESAWALLTIEAKR